jgi:hypothetical protein
MSDITPQEIVSWFKDRAKKYSEIANAIERDFAQGNGEMTRYKRVARTSPLTAEELEKSIRDKSGRVDEVAARLGATPTQVKALLEPASKVYLAERGWLKVRE